MIERCVDTVSIGCINYYIRKAVDIAVRANEVCSDGAVAHSFVAAEGAAERFLYAVDIYTEIREGNCSRRCGFHEAERSVHYKTGYLVIKTQAVESHRYVER